MKIGQRYSLLDILVVIVYGLGFLIIALNMFFANPLSNRENTMIDYINSSFPIVSIFFVSVLLTWIIYEGADSRLWYWLPPLCFFFWCNRLGKQIIVILTVLAVILGMASSYLGPF
jgi:heme/copper-type cytochrome/quinol oxidase subunit 4